MLKKRTGAYREVASFAAPAPVPVRLLLSPPCRLAPAPRSLRKDPIRFRLIPFRAYQALLQRNAFPVAKHRLEPLARHHAGLAAAAGRRGGIPKVEFIPKPGT